MWDNGGMWVLASQKGRSLVGSWEAYNCLGQTERRKRRQRKDRNESKGWVDQRRGDKEIKRKSYRKKLKNERSSVFIELGG